MPDVIYARCSARSPRLAAGGAVPEMLVKGEVRIDDVDGGNERRVYNAGLFVHE